MQLVGPPGAALIEQREVDVGRLADRLLGSNPALAAPIAPISMKLVAPA